MPSIRLSLLSKIEKTKVDECGLKQAKKAKKGVNVPDKPG